MRKPIFAGAIGALAAIAVIAGMFFSETWPFNSSEEGPGQVSDTDTGPGGREDTTVITAPEDILDVGLSVGESVQSEVTRYSAGGDAPEAAESKNSSAATETTVAPESTVAPPSGGPAEVTTVQQSLEFEVRDADGNIRQTGTVK